VNEQIIDGFPHWRDEELETELSSILSAHDRDLVAIGRLPSSRFALEAFEDAVATLNDEERTSAIEVLFEDALDRRGSFEDCIYLEVRARELKLESLANRFAEATVERFERNGIMLAWRNHRSEHLPEVKNIAIAKRNGTATVMLCRPLFNILDIATMRELRHAIELLDKSHQVNELPIVVLTGLGPRAFSTGGDIKEHLPPTYEQMIKETHDLFKAFVKADLLTISKVRGQTQGCAFELVALSDFAIAGESARFRHPEVDLGCFPSVAVALYPLLPEWKALKSIVLTGRALKPHEARALELVTDVVKDEDLDSRVAQLVCELQKKSPIVLRLARKALLGDRDLRDDFIAALDRSERLYLQELGRTHDMKEGLQAFLEKRPPDFTGK